MNGIDALITGRREFASFLGSALPCEVTTGSQLSAAWRRAKT